MKKKWTISGISIAVLLFMWGCAPKPNATVELTALSLEALDVDISSGTVIADADTHGGFHGDGTTFLAIQFDDTVCLDSIEGNPAWKPLPLSENLTALAYGLEKGTSAYGPYLTDEDGDPFFPVIANGYYFFEDRHSESTDPKDDADVLNRHSFNLTLAIYDADTDVLYHCEIDT